MNELNVFHFSDSESFGGAEQALLLLLEHLDPSRFRSTLVVPETGSPRALTDGARNLDITIRTLPAMPLGMQGARHVPTAARMLRRAGPAVFHAHLSWPLACKFPLASAIVARVPAVVATVQLVPTFTPTRSTYLQERMLAAGIGRYIAVSHDVASQLVETFAWPEEKIVVIHNGTRLAPMPPPRTGNGAVVMTTARLVEQKGLEVLVDAAPYVPGAQFVVAGEGPDAAHLAERAATAGVGDRITFLGHRTDVTDLLAAADVFALPSLYEGSSLAILEAMAAGKAVVATAVGGTDELIVDGETGVLVPPRDAGALAAALRRVLGDAQLREKLGRAARARVESRFGAAAVADRVAAVYDALLERLRG